MHIAVSFHEIERRLLNVGRLVHQGLGRKGRDAIFLSGISGSGCGLVKKGERLLHHPLDTDMKNRSEAVNER